MDRHLYPVGGRLDRRRRSDGQAASTRRSDQVQVGPRPRQRDLWSKRRLDRRLECRKFRKLESGKRPSARTEASEVADGKGVGLE